MTNPWRVFSDIKGVVTMLCRVCRHELKGNICDFCGEDNTAYINNAEEEVLEIKESEPKAPEKKKTKYVLNKRKLARFIFILVVLILAIVFAIKLFGSKKEEPPKTDNFLFSSGMLPVSVNGEWGYINKDDPTIFAIAPQFGHVTDFKNDIASVLIGGKYAFIDKEGNLTSEPLFDSVGFMGSNGLIPVETDGKWGYADKKGNIIIDTKYTTASAFAENGTAVVSVGTSYGYIGEDGEYTIAPQFDMALAFTGDGSAPVKTSGKWGYIDESGAALIEPQFDEAFGFEDGTAVVKLYGSYGLIDKEGKFIIKPLFDSRFYFEGDMAVVSIGGKFGMTDKNGSLVISPSYKKLGRFTGEGLAFAERGDGRCGYIDINDEFIIDAIYEDCKSFNLGLAPVKKDGSWGYIDKDGNMAIDTKYLDASEFYDDGYAYVRGVDGSITLIDTAGKALISQTAKTIDNILKH